jgi:glycogen debranching enzyme
MPATHPPERDQDLERFTLSVTGRELVNRTFLLGDRGGFVLYLSTARNEHDRTLQGSKWFGASGFGRSFLEDFRVWTRVDGEDVALDRRNQPLFLAHLDYAERVYRIGDKEIHERFFVPDKSQSVVLSYDGDLPIFVKPEFDMRYYQTFNSDFSQYHADIGDGLLAVSNQVRDVGTLRESLEFHSLTGIPDGRSRLEWVPEAERLIEKTYLKDEHRDKLIHKAYVETQTRAPDEAPIWDTYSTKVFAAGMFEATPPFSLVVTFGDSREEVEKDYTRVCKHLQQSRDRKRKDTVEQLTNGEFETGHEATDIAYAQVLTRFNDALVARDATLHVAPTHRRHFYGIFAGNKYFMDAWKRDENISLGALLISNDYETARRIIDNTWQHQDDRTGRLPHIIRAGEPLVYYSSDGTLWALNRMWQYVKESGDTSILEEKAGMVDHFFGASMDFVQRGLLPSGGIVDSSYLWETWEDTKYTPRAGFPVEIELLWLTALEDFLPYMSERNPSLAAQMQDALSEGQESFKLFYADGYLADSISYDWEPQTILTPNGYIAFGLHFPLPDDLARSIVLQARDQLAGPGGVRSLAPRDWPRVLPKKFLDDPENVKGKDMASVGIFNYHRGVEWEWFNHFFVQGELHGGDVERAYELYVKPQIHEALHEAGAGGLSELRDMHGQLGADFQAWSMAAFIQAVHTFSGIEVDVPGRRLVVCPQLPADWPHLKLRRRLGNTRFDFYCEAAGDRRLIRLHLLDPVPSKFTLRLGIRLPSGSRLGTTRNGDEVMDEYAWRMERACSDGAHTAWTQLPLHGDIDFEATLVTGVS